MQVVILAAGRGVRMGKLTENTPKPMLMLFGKPILEWKLEMLPKTIGEVIFVIGYHGNQIEKHFGAEWHGIKITYVVQEDRNGTGGAMFLVKDMMKGKALVLMGDDLYHPADLEQLTREDVAVLGLKVNNAQQYGLLETTEEGNLLKITERPHGHTVGIVNTGAYILDEKFFRYPLVPISEKEYGLPQTLAEMGKEYPVKVIMATAWQSVGCPEDIEKGEAFLKKYWKI
ncbi:MAG: nucleotidyltransferase family protein [Candidatus Moranbacteria bacterium]|nr:nucleotidyltransferase family protein [Candidatus Moranbacteria bacterium]